jgi:hypothetical protein
VALFGVADIAWEVWYGGVLMWPGRVWQKVLDVESTLARRENLSPKLGVFGVFSARVAF